MGKQIIDNSPEGIRRRERYHQQKTAHHEAVLTGHAYMLMTLVQNETDQTKCVEAIKDYLERNLRV